MLIVHSVPLKTIEINEPLFATFDRMTAVSFSDLYANFFQASQKVVAKTRNKAGPLTYYMFTPSWIRGLVRFRITGRAARTVLCTCKEI